MLPNRELALPIETDLPRRAPLRELTGTERNVVIAGPRCDCGHGRQAHEHYRRGNDCAMCTCAKFSRPFLARLGLRGR